MAGIKLILIQSPTWGSRHMFDRDKIAIFTFYFSWYHWFITQIILICVSALWYSDQTMWGVGVFDFCLLHQFFYCYWQCQWNMLYVITFWTLYKLCITRIIKYLCVVDAEKKTQNFGKFHVPSFPSFLAYKLASSVDFMQIYN